MEASSIRRKSFKFAPPSLALAVPPQERRRPSPPVSSDLGAFHWSWSLGRSSRASPPNHQTRPEALRGLWGCSQGAGQGHGAGRNFCHCLLLRSPSSFLLYFEKKFAGRGGVTAKKPNQFNVDHADSARCWGKELPAMGQWEHNGSRV